MKMKLYLVLATALLLLSACAVEETTLEQPPFQDAEEIEQEEVEEATEEEIEESEEIVEEIEDVEEVEDIDEVDEAEDYTEDNVLRQSIKQTSSEQEVSRQIIETASSEEDVLLTMPENANVGEIFSLIVEANNVEDVFGTSIKFSMDDPENVDLVNTNTGDFLSQDGLGLLDFYIFDKGNTDYLDFAVTRRGGDNNGVSGSGVITTLDLKINEPGTYTFTAEDFVTTYCSEGLESCEYVENTLSPVSITIEEAEIEITEEKDEDKAKEETEEPKEKDEEDEEKDSETVIRKSTDNLEVGETFIIEVEAINMKDLFGVSTGFEVSNPSALNLVGDEVTELLSRDGNSLIDFFIYRETASENIGSAVTRTGSENSGIDASGVIYSIELEGMESGEVTLIPNLTLSFCNSDGSECYEEVQKHADLTLNIE